MNASRILLILIASIATSSAVAATSPVLPDLMAVDIYLDLQPKGFTFDDWKQQRTRSMKCGKSNNGVADVCIYSPNVTQVQMVEAAYVGLDAKSRSFARDFFGYLATLPFKGNNASASRAWVEKAVMATKTGKPYSITRYGAKWEVSGTGTSFFLRIQAVK